MLTTSFIDVGPWHTIFATLDPVTRNTSLAGAGLYARKVEATSLRCASIPDS